MTRSTQVKNLSIPFAFKFKSKKSRTILRKEDYSSFHFKNRYLVGVNDTTDENRILS